MAEEMKSRLRSVARRINTLAGEKGKRELAVLQEEMAEVRKKLESPAFKPPTPEPVAARLKGIAPGERVLIEGLESAAEVLAGPDDRQMVEVQAGPVRMRVHQDRIKGKDRKPRPLQRAVFVSPEVNSRAQVGPELWVHGMRAQQAVEAVGEYLEKAALAGHMRVRIIHGKGRGILRHAIHQFLGDHPLVGTFRDADPDEGGEGVSVVEF
jgi:DNA mismatch repair protein MutS2